MSKQFTAAFVDSLKAPEKGQQDYWDGKLSGFGIRVSQGGRKTWTVIYRHIGRMRRLTLGTYPTTPLATARDRAKEALFEAQNGGDPAGRKKELRDSESFSELCHSYLEKHAAQKRSRMEDERIIKKELLPSWGNTKASEIRRRDVIGLLDNIVERDAGIMANRTKALISKIFNFGISREIVELNPAQGVSRPVPENRRDRVLNPDEIRTFWKALDNENPKIAAILKLALLTAQRRGEILGLRRSELDFAQGWWTIPASRAKNQQEHRVPLTSMAVEILQGQATSDRSTEIVFPGSKADQPIANLQKPLARIRARTGLDFHFHDLRRTAASQMASSGIPRLVISKLLNHVERGVTAIYDRYGYDLEKRDAVTKWEGHLRGILDNNIQSHEHSV